MSSLYIENDSSYYVMYVYKHGYLSIGHYDTIKKVNSCIKRNGSPPIIYETLYKEHFSDKVFNTITKLLSMYKETDDVLIKELAIKFIHSKALSLIRSYDYYFDNREEDNSVLEDNSIVGEFPS